MQKFQLDLPLPSQGINLTDDSLISDNEAAEGTLNMSFKDGLPQTRKGYVKQTLYEHAGEDYNITKLDFHFIGGEKRLLFASNGHLYQMNEDKTPARRDLGVVSSTVPAALNVPCALGTSRTTLEPIADFTFKSVATKTITVNELILSTTAQALIGRRFVLKGVTYSVAACAAGEPGLATITVNETISGSPAANDPMAMRNDMTVKSLATKTITIYEVLSAQEAATLVGRSVVIQGATKTITAAVAGSAGAATFTVAETVTAADGDIVTATSIAYSEKTFVLDGAAFRYFDESNTLTAVQAYSPTTAEVSAYGTNVLITTPDEINKQRWMVSDENRLWAAGYGNLVRVSHLGVAGAMPDYWPSTQAIKLPEDCTGIARYMGDVLLFTKNTATLVTGSTPVITMDDSYKNIQLPGGYGCERHETIAVGDNAVYWANQSGVYRYRYQPSGFSIPECVSEFMLQNGHTRTVQKKIDAITDWTKVWAVFFDHEYRLYTGAGQVLVFDTINSSWTQYSYTLNFDCGAVYQDELYYGSGSAVSTKYHIYHMDYMFTPGDASYKGLSDDGVAISFVLKSKFFDFNKAANKKRFVRLYLSLYSEFVSYINDITINIDNADVTYEQAMHNKISRWGNNDPADDSTESGYVFCFGDAFRTAKTNTNYPIRISHRGKRYNIQYTITCDGLNYAWVLKSAVLLFKMKELK